LFCREIALTTESKILTAKIAKGLAKNAEKISSLSYFSANFALASAISAVKVLLLFNKIALAQIANSWHLQASSYERTPEWRISQLKR